MAKNLLIDASHADETRVVLLDGEHVEEFGVETRAKARIAGNIYLAKVIRVEAALQAVFVDYGGERNGFLPFPEIHPDYYVIPVGDRDEAIEDDSADPQEPAASESTDGDIPGMEIVSDQDEEEEGSAQDLLPDTDHDGDADEKTKNRLRRRYKIQEVIRHSQLLLVQVAKDERGGKGAALTTYISLAGRYCVLMPNSRRNSGGVSNKITNKADRKRLKDVAEELEIPPSAGLIFRTAGARRTKAEIKTDFEYLVGQWNLIRRLTLESLAPALIHTEAGIIKRTIRDIYSSDVQSVCVEGHDGFKTASDFMSSIIPSDAGKVQLHGGPDGLFESRNLEGVLEGLSDPVVPLPSGGHIVIGITEALIAIDVNSGRSVKQGTLEETALQTNLEAAREVARQLRLRELAGLIVIDFVDMDKTEHNRQVEKTLKESVKNDRSKIQMGRISQFGLIEMTRQRLRPSLHEMIGLPCSDCNGSGWMRSPHSIALKLLSQAESEARRARKGDILCRVAPGLATVLLNDLRSVIDDLESRCDVRLRLEIDATLSTSAFEIRVPRSPKRSGSKRQDRQTAHARSGNSAHSEQRQSRSGGAQRQSKHQGSSGEAEQSDTRSQSGDRADGGETPPETGSESSGRSRRRRRGSRRRSSGQAKPNSGNAESQPDSEAS